jgi:hypothetical protein
LVTALTLLKKYDIIIIEKLRKELIFMPAYRKTSVYSPMINGEIRMRLIDVLASSPEALSMKQMKAEDMFLSNLTTQKMSRELNHLVEMGLVRKAQSKKDKCMVYKAVSVMLAQGYDIDEGDNDD